MPRAVVRFHRLAAREYQAARAWYAARSVSAARKFREEMRRVILRIAAAPEQGTVYGGPYLWMRLRRYPYLLYYREVVAGQVVIYAVMHSRRRPGYWRWRTTSP